MSTTTPLDIKVRRIHKLTSNHGLKAFADIIVNEAILIKGIRVLEGSNGIFVSMPREQSAKDKKWYETVKCLTRETQELVSQEVLKAYAQEDKIS